MVNNKGLLQKRCGSPLFINLLSHLLFGKFAPVGKQNIRSMDGITAAARSGFITAPAVVPTVGNITAAVIFAAVAVAVRGDQTEPVIENAPPQNQTDLDKGF